MNTEAAQILFDWLALNDPLPEDPADAILGFGHFDLAIPRHCVDLIQSGHASHLIFTGGIGAGTADLGQPEADAFAEEAHRYAPELASRTITENQSTNTAENLHFTRDLLLTRHPALALGIGIRSVLLVATTCRQRRVWLTWRKLFPEIPCWNAPVPTSLEKLTLLYSSKGEDIVEQIKGEYERIRDYPTKGWIESDPIPDEVTQAYISLQ